MRGSERAGYRAHALLPPFRRRVESALATIRTALEEHPVVWAVACSGGKDSAALLALAVEAGWRGPVLFLRYRETPGENERLAGDIAARYGLALDVLDVPGAWDVFDAVGYAFRTPTLPVERSVTAAMLRNYKTVAEAHAVARGWGGEFWGLRRQESVVRAISLARTGTTYTVRDRSTVTCCPLATWTGRDVWAYTVTRDLPWLSRYDWPGEDRERIRSETTWLAAEGLWRHGQAERMRRFDPETWTTAVVRYPEIQTWS